MADLVKYPAEVLQAVYKTHRHADLDKVVNRIEQGQRRFYGELTFRTPTVEGNRIFSDGLFA